MPHNEIVYLVFGMVLVIALVADLGLMSKKGKVVTMQSAIYLTLFWVLLAFAFFVFMLYTGFDALSKLPVFSGMLDYYIELLGINFHYQSVSRGVIDTRDLVYFFVVIVFFLFITQKNVIRH